MKGQKQQYVTIKGTKDGLTLHLDDTCSFQDLVAELEEKLALNQRHEEGGPYLPVRLKVGNRYVTSDQREELQALIRSKKHLAVDSIESNVISKEEALELKRETEIVSASKVVRSGQILKVQGDLLLIGDVNPGGTVIAEGNIFILGALRGIAHAGCNGNRQAVIAASIMKPSQLRISDIMNRAPDYHQDDRNEMECAYIDEFGKIVVDRLQLLTHLRPNLTRFEGGI
ncbi:septum site-determining protein MinC [Cytobacillus sp. S13-E01]|uniref:septum site-determining protein MinC n=1 Tax=Cytobacillus sp. S13-E01 TaxID=3031326 RepID=UPI0023D7F6DF|nr:septum site-determining protein MinC [Cytobacillus sp. S13-E01]MDF0726770.1 septum site-determining protein MinC [Cytobacillus sp. S13-E01]